MTTSSPDPLPHASHVGRARRASTMSCGHAVNVGNVIVRRNGRWTCLECALAAIRAKTTTTTGGRQP